MQQKNKVKFLHNQKPVPFVQDAPVHGDPLINQETGIATTTQLKMNSVDGYAVIAIWPNTIIVMVKVKYNVS
jgi:hypothetical protein